jgi:hypothetical protein
MKGREPAAVCRTFQKGLTPAFGDLAGPFLQIRGRYEVRRIGPTMVKRADVPAKGHVTFAHQAYRRLLLARRDVKVGDPVTDRLAKAVVHSLPGDVKS